jgi:hypothetical protein
MQFSLPGFILALACLICGVVLIITGNTEPGMLLLGAAVGTLGPSPVSRA